MSSSEQHKRLDQILLAEGLVTESEIKDALYRQKSSGGKFGSQLLYHRYIDEEGLVKALAIQLSCEGVVLTQCDIPDDVVQRIPKKIAMARRVIAFEDDPKTNTLKVACEDPKDPSIARELAFAARGRQIKLYVAAEAALSSALAHYYEHKEDTLEQRQLLEIPDILTKSDGEYTTHNNDSDQVEDPRLSVLLVSDEAYAAPIVQSLLERDNYRVVHCESLEEAIVALNGQRYHTVFIRESVSGDPKGLIELVRKSSPRTQVRLYDTASSLLIHNEVIEAENDLLLPSLELFTSLLSSRAKSPVNYGSRVAKYSSRLAHRLGLPERDRLAITTASYVHDLARFYYGMGENEDKRHVIDLTVRLLASLGFPNDVVEILRAMYQLLSGDRTTQPPISVIGGNILTVADLYCDSIPADVRLSFDKFDAVKKTLRDQIGKLLLPEVVESFIEMMAGEVLDLQTSRQVGQVMIYSEDAHFLQPLELRLRNESFRTVSEGTPTDLVALYKRSRPDMMVLSLKGDAPTAISFVNDLVEIGIQFESTPTFLLVGTEVVGKMTELLERGVEDILPQDDNLDLLVTKLHKQQAKLDARARANREAALAAKGAHGRLADMNLIDLLQALGPGRKTVHITVERSETQNEELAIYLKDGEIIYAKFERLSGAEAIYEGLTWTVGAWTVEPVELEDLPARNNKLSNESILMEGLRLVDEKVRAGQLL